MFFLKAEEGKDGAKRVRVFCELENGFVGLVDESIKQAQPHLWTKFESGLKDYGEDKAKKEAEKNGEFRLPEEPRLAGVIEREIEATEAKLSSLKDELKAAKKNDASKAASSGNGGEDETPEDSGDETPEDSGDEDNEI